MGNKACSFTTKSSKNNNKNNKSTNIQDIEGLVTDIIHKSDEGELSLETQKPMTFLNVASRRNKATFPKSLISSKLISNPILEMSNELAILITNKVINRETSCNLYDSKTVSQDLHKYYYKHLTNYNEKINFLSPLEWIPDTLCRNDEEYIIDSSISYKSSYFNSERSEKISGDLAYKKSFNMSKSLIKSPQAKKLNSKNKIIDKNKPTNSQSLMKKITGVGTDNMNSKGKSNGNKMINTSGFETSIYRNNNKLLKNFNTNKYAIRFNQELELGKIRRKSLMPNPIENQQIFKNEQPSIVIDLRTLNTEVSLNIVDNNSINKEMLNCYTEDKVNTKKSFETIKNALSSSNNRLKKIKLKKR